MTHKLWVYWLTLKLCMKSIGRNKLNLGDQVLYRGELWRLTQGVADPYWNMHRLRDNERKENVHRREFRKLLFRNILRDLRSTWRFYSGYWHQIWFQQTKQEVLNSPIRGFKP